jgi:hypothetical protein
MVLPPRVVAADVTAGVQRLAAFSRSAAAAPANSYDVDGGASGDSGGTFSSTTFGSHLDGRYGADDPG